MSDTNIPPPSAADETTVVLLDKGLRRLAGGFTQVPNFMLRHEGISIGAKLTYAMLLSYAWQENFARPAQETLARDLNASERSVRAWLSELRKARFIDWKRSGFNRPNIYSILAIPDSAHLAAPSSAKSRGTGRICRSGPEESAAMDRQILPHKKTQEKKTHPTHTGFARGVLFSSKTQDLARVLVQRFLNEQGRAPREASAKELDFASRLISEHGYAQADYVLSYSLETAQETNYKARFLQGYEQYVAEALTGFAEHQKRQAQRQRLEAQRRDHDDEDLREKVAFYAEPIETRVDRAVTTWIRTTKLVKQREPTPEEVEERRSFFTQMQQREEAQWREQLAQVAKPSR